MFRALIGLFAVVAVCSAKVDVAVYYESLCPDSQAFITQQLYPALKSGLNDFVNVKFIPFGKASFTTQGSDVSFTCQHGPNECYGNRVQACAIEHIEGNSYRTDRTKESLVLDYINCLMMVGKNFQDNIYPGEKCARELELQKFWMMISECANGTQGAQLLKQYGEITQSLKPMLTSVPTVTFNQRFEPDMQQQAINDFRGTLCTFISEPRLCAASNAVMSAVFTPVVLIAAFILSRMV